MDKVFFANITPVNSNRNRDWKIQAGINDRVLIEEVMPEEHLATALLCRFDDSFTLDSFVKKGDANPDPYERFIRNPYQRKDIAEELNQEHKKNTEYRIFSSVNQVKRVLYNFFKIDRDIKMLAHKEGIPLEQVQRVFKKAMLNIIK